MAAWGYTDMVVECWCQSSYQKEIGKVTWSRAYTKTMTGSGVTSRVVDTIVHRYAAR
jgi:hypothetical protein